MSTDLKALCTELTNELHKHASLYEGHESELVARARTALSQPGLVERPVWTEGVCEDSAAILKDGVMQPIEDVIAALNAAELAQPELPADWEVAKLTRLLREEVRELRESGSIGHLTIDERLRVADLLEQLARSKPVGPSLEEVEDLCEEHEFCVEGYESTECLQGLINDAVARYSGPTIAPIHVSERPWEQEGFCDANGCCWWFHRETFGRNACWCYSRGSGVEVFCLPHWALPISAAPETV
jgi:hypothetical protein